MENEAPKPPQPLSDTEIQTYVAADAALTTTKPWELEVTSKRMKLYAYLAAAITIALHTFLALIVTVGDTGTAITIIDQWGYFLVGVLFAALIFIGLHRPRIRVNADGVDVRNFIGSRFYPWSVIYGLSFPEGARVARLELPEFEYVPMWALLAADGPDCVKAIATFRDLEAQYMPED
ncbi:MAG: PH domain-containing protein [Corynebacterium sp.]|nr:PH domain-containing protein [Corynebacterium sp.]